MKRLYEKPTLTDLSLPTARAGWLPGGGASPQGTCNSGFHPNDPVLGSCGGGYAANSPGSCGGGGSPLASQNNCVTGAGAS